MKFSGGSILLILLAMALFCAMVITLWLGGNRSRHGYGYHPRSAPFAMQMVTYPEV